MRAAVLIRTAAVALAAAACNLEGTKYGDTVLTPPPNSVLMENLTYNPNNLTVPVGTTVTWINDDVYTHAVVQSSGPDSAFADTVVVGGKFQHTFTVAGTYAYYCTYHGTPTTGMHGAVLVQ